MNNLNVGEILCKMNRILLFLSLFILFGSSIFGQTNRKVSLIVSECKQVFPDSVCYSISREYVKYQFQNGQLIGKEVLMANEENPFEFDLYGENNHLYQNKFLISKDGDVYDFEKKKIIFRSNDGALLARTGDKIVRNLGLVAVLGNRVYTRLSLTTPEITEQEALFYFDLKTSKYKIIREVKNFPDIEQSNFSPNNKFLAVYEKSKLIFYQIDTNFNFVKIRTVNLQPVSPRKTTDDSGEPDPSEYSIVWVDNQNVLTVNNKREIVKVSITGKIFPIIKPKENESNALLPKIEKDRFGNFYIYPCQEYSRKVDSSACRITLTSKTLSSDDIPIGNNFDQVQNKTTQKSEYLYKGKLIGNPKEDLNDKNVNVKAQGEKTINGYIATAYSEKYNKIGYIKVWNNIKNGWIKIDLKWHPENFLIGWIEE